MQPNPKQNPHIGSDTGLSPDILDSCKTQLAAFLKEEHRVKDEIERIRLVLRYRDAQVVGDDMMEWKAMIGREMTVRNEKMLETKKLLESLRWERDGIQELGGRK